MKRLIFCSILFACLLACSDEKQVSDLASAISALEAEVGKGTQTNNVQLEELLAKYEEYAALKGADNQLIAAHWLRAGEMSARLQQFDRALGYYDKLLNEMPESPKAPRALFMKAYTLDNFMGKLEEAKKTYELFLEKYPEDDFADDAQFSLKNLGKSPEEIVKEFEAAQQQQ